MPKKLNNLVIQTLLPLTLEIELSGDNLEIRGSV